MAEVSGPGESDGGQMKIEIPPLTFAEDQEDEESPEGQESPESEDKANAPQEGGTTPNQESNGKRKRSLPGTPDPDAEVVALSPRTLLATNRFVCEICNKGFQRDQNLQLHRRGHNLPWKLRQRTTKEVKKKVYICPEPTCIHHDPARALGDLTGIKKHFCRKHGEKKFKCEKCSKRYAVQSDYKAHLKTCGTREYRCDCGTLFSRRDSFITHRAFCDALAETGPSGLKSEPQDLIGGETSPSSALAGSSHALLLEAAGLDKASLANNGVLSQNDALSLMPPPKWSNAQANQQQQQQQQLQQHDANAILRQGSGLGLWLGQGPDAVNQASGQGPLAGLTPQQILQTASQSGLLGNIRGLGGLLDGTALNALGGGMNQDLLLQQQVLQNLGGGGGQLLSGLDLVNSGLLQGAGGQASPTSALLASLFGSNGGQAAGVGSQAQQAAQNMGGQQAADAAAAPSGGGYAGGYPGNLLGSESAALSALAGQGLGGMRPGGMALPELLQQLTGAVGGGSGMDSNGGAGGNLGGNSSLLASAAESLVKQGGGGLGQNGSLSSLANLLAQNGMQNVPHLQQDSLLQRVAQKLQGGGQLPNVNALLGAGNNLGGNNANSAALLSALGLYPDGNNTLAMLSALLPQANNQSGLQQGGLQQGGLQQGGMQQGGLQQGGMQQGGMQQSGLQQGGMQQAGLQQVGLQHQVDAQGGQNVFVGNGSNTNLASLVGTAGAASSSPGGGARAANNSDGTGAGGTNGEGGGNAGFSGIGGQMDPQQMIGNQLGASGRFTGVQGLLGASLGSSGGNSGAGGIQNLQEFLNMAASQGMLNQTSMQGLLSQASAQGLLQGANLQNLAAASGQDLQALTRAQSGDFKGLATRDFLGLARTMSPRDLSNFRDLAAFGVQVDNQMNAQGTAGVNPVGQSS